MSGTQGYDIIGDIHGHADELKALLAKLDYHWVDGCYRHESRKVIFLGDFIDRGPKQREVLQTVIPMVKQGSALAVMGNHEFNALAFHTPDPEHPGCWLRPRTNKNIRQHQSFLSEYLTDDAELNSVLEFFHSLPLWLDLDDGLRVVHACWEPTHISALSHQNNLTPERLIEACIKGTPAYDAIEALLKGVEHHLPKGMTFLDKDGHERNAVRTRWWINHDCSMHDVAFPSGILDAETGQMPVCANDLVGYPISEKPVFIGHYWMKGAPELMAPNLACLDYSVAKDGKLVAYRWSGEQTLSNDNFVHL